MNKDDLTGLNRLLFAAVVDSGFRKLLLNHPSIAVEMEYNQEVLGLTPDAKRIASSVQTKSLKQFAQCLISPDEGIMPDEEKIEEELLREMHDLHIRITALAGKKTGSCPPSNLKNS